MKMLAFANFAATCGALAPFIDIVSKPVVDGSAAADRTWEREALLRGYQNSAELAAKEVRASSRRATSVAQRDTPAPLRTRCALPQVRCAKLPSDLVGTYYRNGHARFVGWDGRKVRHPFDADGMVCSRCRMGMAVWP